MRLTKMRLTGQSSVDFPILGLKASDPYVLRNVDGLGPSDVDIFIADTVDQGGVYQSRRAQGRQVVMTIGLTADYLTNVSPAKRRQDLYTFLGSNPGGVTVALLEGETVVMQTLGYISKFEPTIFDKDPAVAITLTCPSPYFQSPNAVIYTTTNGLQNGADSNIVNPGSARSGFVAVFTFKGSTTNITLDVNGEQIILSDGVATNDIFNITTIPGSRFIGVNRAGVNTNLLKFMTAASTWPQLNPGQNVVKVINSSGAYSSIVWGYLAYIPNYLGV